MKKLIILIPLFCLTISGWSQQLFPFNKDTLWGVVDETKQLIVPPIYDKVFFFQNYNQANATAIIRKNNKFGLINRAGKVIVPINNNRINYYESNPNYLWVSDGKNKKGLFNSSEQEFFLECAYKNIFFVREKNDFIQLAKKEGQGIINIEKKVIVPVEYDYIKLGKDKNDTCLTFSAFKNKKEYKYTCKGELISDKKIKSDENQTVFLDQSLDDNEVFRSVPKRPTRKKVDLEKVKAEPQIKALLQKYQLVNFYQNIENDIIVVLSKDNKYGFANRQGEIIIPVVHDNFKKTLPTDIFVTLIGEKKGIINLRTGKVVVDVIFDKINIQGHFESHLIPISLNYFYAEKEGVGGYLNWETGKYFIPK